MYFANNISEIYNKSIVIQYKPISKHCETSKIKKEYLVKRVNG